MAVFVIMEIHVRMLDHHLKKKFGKNFLTPTIGKICIFSCLFSLWLDLFIPMSDQEKISPCNIYTMSGRRVVRVEININ